jgi:hypothetical protein
MTSQFMRLVVRPARDVDRLLDGLMDYARQFQGRGQYEDDPVDSRIVNRMESMRESRRGWASQGETWSQNDDVPDNLIQYPSRRSDYTGRRVVNG